MNINEGTSGTSIQAGEEKPKTFNEYLNEAENLYKKFGPLIESCASAYSDRSADDNEINDDDNDITIIRKMNSMLTLEKMFQDAMNICQAKENIESALKQGNTKKAKNLESEIEALFKEATGAQFQCLKAMTMMKKSLLIDSLAERYDAVEQLAANTSDRKIIQLKDRIGRLMDKYPSPHKCFWDAIKESFNYEKRFSNDDSAAHHRNALREIRETWEGSTYDRLYTQLTQCTNEINMNQYCLPVPARSITREHATRLSDEDIVNNTKLLDNAIKGIRNIIEYIELLSDSQTPKTNPDKDWAEISRAKHEYSLNLLTAFQAMLAFWQSTEFVKRIDTLRVNEDVKKNALRIDKAARELARGIIDCYPNVVRLENTPQLFSEPERNLLLSLLAKSHEFIAGECHRLTGSLPKKHSETLIKLGDALSGVGESISKELELKGLRILLSDSEIKEFIDNLFDAESIWPQEEDIDEVASFDERVDNQLTGAEHEVRTDTAGREITFGSSALSAKEERVIARLVQEADGNKKEKSQQIKGISEDKRKLEKIEQKLAENREKVERIKQALKEGAETRYLAWDLENVPKKAARFAQLAQKKTLSIAAKLEALEEFSLSKGAVSDDEHRSQISEYARKAVEYGKLEKQCRSDGKELQIASIKASLGIEAVRKSNAAKRLLIELADLEKDPESLNVTACKTLPHCPQAKNQFGILETEKGQPLYDHVVEFRVELENVPAFVVHFHFRHPLETGKAPDYYVEKMEIHDWNVQALQKQESEERIRSRQVEGGKNVLVALNEAWRKSLEINKGKKEIAPRTSTTPASAASAPPSGKQKNKGKARRR
jgi:hypothetical protein